MITQRVSTRILNNPDHIFRRVVFLLSLIVDELMNDDDGSRVNQFQPNQSERMWRRKTF